MASIRQLSNGQWEVRWRDPRTGSQPRRRLPNKSVAHRVYADALHIEGLDPRTPVDRRLSVAELIEEEARRSERTQSTDKTRRSYLTNHVPGWLLDLDAHLVVIEHIEDVLLDAGEKMSRPSVEKLRSILHSVFKYGVERRVLDRNPVKGARIGTECQPSARARKIVDQEVDPEEIPSPLECQAIAHAIDSRFRVLVQVLYLVGLRLGEAVALDVSDWNPDSRILRVRRSGPGSEKTKGKREFRDVDVMAPLARRIDEHVAAYCQPDGPLFPGRGGGRLTPGNFRKRYFYPAVDKALGQAGRDEDKRRRIRPHDLRHTAASIMITEGVSDIEIAHQLGHEDTTVTRRVYAGVWRRVEREVSAKLEARAAEIL